jgi:hypothetical protein
MMQDLLLGATDKIAGDEMQYAYWIGGHGEVHYLVVLTHSLRRIPKAAAT